MSMGQNGLALIRTISCVFSKLSRVHPIELHADNYSTDFYNFLQFSGIDSVKTDAQFMLDQLQSARDRRRMIRPYQDAWSIANLRYMGARAISCMSQTPQILFHSQLPTNKPRLCVRNSDDFFPEIESSHPWHIFCNAYNSLYTQHLNVCGDFLTCVYFKKILDDLNQPKPFTKIQHSLSSILIT
jgi:hypothetical protein